MLLRLSYGARRHDPVLAGAGAGGAGPDPVAGANSRSSGKGAHSCCFRSHTFSVVLPFSICLADLRLFAGVLNQQQQQQQQQPLASGSDHGARPIAVIRVYKDYRVQHQVALRLLDSTAPPAEPLPDDLGRMTVLCDHCGAKHYLQERLPTSSRCNPRFGNCCLQGKVHLPPVEAPPAVLLNLYTSTDRAGKQFREKIRQYNCALQWLQAACSWTNSAAQVGSQGLLAVP